MMTHRDLQNSARDGDTSGRQADKERALPAEPTLEELVEAREQMDAGLRLAFPMLTEQVASEPAKPRPTISHEEGTAAAHELLNAEDALRKAARAVALEGNITFHLHLNVALNELREAGSELTDGWES